MYILNDTKNYNSIFGVQNTMPKEKYCVNMFNSVLARYDMESAYDREKFLKLTSIFPKDIIKTGKSSFSKWAIITNPLYNLLKYHFELMPVWRD